MGHADATADDGPTWLRLASVPLALFALQWVPSLSVSLAFRIDGLAAQMLAMIGAVGADNVVLLFLFWKLNSRTSFLLVGFNHADVHARAAAREALLVTMGGGLALLGGLLLLAQMAGSWTLSGGVTPSRGLTRLRRKTSWQPGRA